jgi:hypothetical protein
MRTYTRYLPIVLALLVWFNVDSALAQDGLEGAISFTHKHEDPSLNGPPITFIADLSADEQSAVVHSPGSGKAEFTLDRQTLKLSWKLNFSGLTSPALGAAIHGPGTPGVNAGVMFDLAPKGLARSTSGQTTGSVVLTDGELKYLLMGWMYVNVTSEKYKDGELRGTLKRVRAPGSKPGAKQPASKPDSKPASK